MKTERKAMAVEAGDVLMRPKGLVTHMGIALAEERVFHNTPEDGEHVSSFEEFSQGEPVSLVKTSPGVHTIVLQRIQQSLMNPKKYDLLSNNCEHTVTRLTKGVRESQQVQSGLGMIFIVIVSYLLLKD